MSRYFADANGTNMEDARGEDPHGYGERHGFEKELEALINRYSMESDSNTPDFILAEYLRQCLKSFNSAVCAREAWHGRGVEAYHPEVLGVHSGDPTSTEPK